MSTACMPNEIEEAIDGSNIQMQQQPHLQGASPHGMMESTGEQVSCMVAARAVRLGRGSGSV